MGILYGVLNLSFWGYVVALLILTHVTIVGVTVYLHLSKRIVRWICIQLSVISSDFASG